MLNDKYKIFLTIILILLFFDKGQKFEIVKYNQTNPPIFLSYELDVENKTFMLVFDKNIFAKKIKSNKKILSDTSLDNKLFITLEGDIDGFVEFEIFLKDEYQNTLTFILPLTVSTSAPKLLINKLYINKDKSYLELIALQNGNLDGVCINITSTFYNEITYIFKPQSVKSGDIITVGDIKIPQTKGIITLHKTAQFSVMDALCYMNDENITKANLNTNQQYKALFKELILQNQWTGKGGDLFSLVNFKAGQRALIERKSNVDTNSKYDFLYNEVYANFEDLKSVDSKYQMYSKDNSTVKLQTKSGLTNLETQKQKVVDKPQPKDLNLSYKTDKQIVIEEFFISQKSTYFKVKFNKDMNLSDIYLYITGQKYNENYYHFGDIDVKSGDVVLLDKALIGFDFPKTKAIVKIIDNKTKAIIDVLCYIDVVKKSYNGFGSKGYYEEFTALTKNGKWVGKDTQDLIFIGKSKALKRFQDTNSSKDFR